MSNLRNTFGEDQPITEGVVADGGADKLPEVDATTERGVSYTQLIVTLGAAGALLGLMARGDSNESPRTKSKGEVRSDDEEVARRLTAAQDDARWKTLNVPGDQDHSRNLGQA